MSPDQKEILTNLVRDETTTITTIEYPASAGEDSFRCLKVCYVVPINGVDREFVDWYGVEGGLVATREITKAVTG